MDFSKYEKRIKKLKPVKIRGVDYYQIVYEGKKIRATTKAELLEKIKGKIENKPKTDRENITVTEYTAEWLEYKAERVQQQTIEDYNYYAVTVAGLFGGDKIKDLRPLYIENKIQAYANTKNKKTKRYPSHSQIRHIISTLQQVLQMALKEGIIDVNPATSLDVKSRGAHGEGHRTLEEAEINAVLNTEHDMQIPALIMLLMGLRPEEMVALTYGDIKLTDAGVTVDICKRAILNSAEKTKIQAETKTKAGIRTLYAPEPLKSLLIAEKGKRKEYDLLLGTTKTKRRVQKDDGTYRYEDVDYKRPQPISATCLRTRWSRYIDTLIEKNKGVEKFTMYDLRHTYITMLYGAGVPIVTAAAAAGHAKTSTAQKYYVDWSKISTEETVPAVEKMLKKAKKSE